MASAKRPELTPGLTGREFSRWCWLKAELIACAKTLGIRTTGSKDTLTARITAALDGLPFTEPQATVAKPGKQLTGHLTSSSVIPAGQRCSRVVRDWFVSQVGTGFRFDAPMREFFARTTGSQTLQDALDHYRATRTTTPQPIDSQFEFNRFTRDWYARNPGGSRQEMLAAWQAVKALPIEDPPLR
jgi:hypothetical protein